MHPPSTECAWHHLVRHHCFFATHIARPPSESRTSLFHLTLLGALARLLLSATQSRSATPTLSYWFLATFVLGRFFAPLRPQIVLGSSKGKLPNVWEGPLSQCFGRLWLCWPFPAIHGALGVSTLHGALFAHSSLEPRIGRAMAMTGRYVWTLPSTIL